MYIKAWKCSRTLPSKPSHTPIYFQPYPTDYRFCLSGEYPYLLESATTVEKEDTMYKTTVSSKKFYYVFCSSENPTDLTTEQKYTEQHNKIMTIVLFSLICITILVFIVSITKLILSNTKKH